MSNPKDFRISPSERIAELIIDLTVGGSDFFVYTFDHGYESIKLKHDKGGEMKFQGAIHPVDGLCHSKDDVVDGSDGICVHCGRTLM